MIWTSTYVRGGAGPALLFLFLAAADPGIGAAAGLDHLKLQSIADAPSAAAGGPASGTAATADPRAEQVGRRLRESVGKLNARTRAVRQAEPAISSRQRQAIAVLRARLGAALEIRGIEVAGTPRQIRGAILEKASNLGVDSKASDEKTARAFLRKQRALLDLDDPDREMAAPAYSQDDLGRRHLRFEQCYRGLPVWPADLLVHLDPEGNVDGMDGAYVPTPRGMATQPVVDRAAALERARREIPDGDQAHADTPELMIYAPGNRPPRLAWACILEISPAARWRVLIDAVNGAVLKSYNEVMEGGAGGSGVDLLGVPRGLNLWQQDSLFYLEDTSKAMFDPSSVPPARVQGGIVVYDARNQPPTRDPSGNLGDITLYFLTSSDPFSGWLADGVSAAFNLSQTYDYYLARHHRNSLDNGGSSMFAVVRYGAGFANAFYNGQVMAFGDAKPYAAALDVVAHELTHGVTRHTANLEYVDQSGALNEAFSDIFGSAVEAYSRGTTDWLMGEVLGSPLRDLKDPSSLTICCGRNYPSKMSEYILPTDPFLSHFPGRDNGGVHLNSGIINRAFYLLAEGLDGAVGIRDAERIFYRALVFHLVKNSQFADTRLAAIASAEELFGPGSSQAGKTAEAFDTVEIFGGSETPNPEPLPEIAAEDSALCVYYNATAREYRLCRRENALGDPAVGINLSTYAVAAAKASVSGDGSLAIAVSADHDVCLLATRDVPSTEADCLGLPGQISSVAMAPDGERFAFVFLDNSGNPENAISLIDLNASAPKTLVLKGTAEDGSPVDIEFADSMAFTVDGRFLLYDAFNNIQVADGSKIGVWSIYALDTASDRFLTILPPTEGLDISFPSAGHIQGDLLAFEAVDQATGVSYVLTGNINTGDITRIATVNSAFFAVPGFMGDDSALVYSVQDATAPTGTSLWKQPLSADHLAAQGTPSLWLQDAHYGTVYRRGTFSGVPEYRLSVTVDGAGTVSSDPAGIDCAPDCEALFFQGTAVTLMATPAAGLSVAGWTGCDQATGGLCGLNMNADRNPAVRFAAASGTPSPVPGPGELPLPPAVPDSPWDLEGRWKNVRPVCRGAGNAGKCRIKGKLVVRNSGMRKAQRSKIVLYLSQDPILTADDVPVSRRAIGAIGRHKARQKAFKTGFLPRANVAGHYLIAVIDTDNSITESNESNNRISFGPLP